MQTLAQIRPVSTVRVADVLGDDALAARIMEMGIFEDQLIKVVGVAPLGDPMELEVQGYRLSMRKDEASRVLVAAEPLPK